MSLSLLRQFQRAHQLADAHGHEWAVIIIAPDPFYQGADSRYLAYPAGVPWHTLATDQCRRALARIHGGLAAPQDYDTVMDEGLHFRGVRCPGIKPPFQTEDGVVRHSTGSGRCRWEISPEGEVVITISRPEGDILRLTVPALASGGEPEFERLNWEVPVYLRHCAAMARCASALGVSFDPQVNIQDEDAHCAAMAASRAIDYWEDRSDGV